MSRVFSLWRNLVHRNRIERDRFGVQPTDVPTLAAVALTMALVAAMACWLPAWRASRLDPNVVLRDE